MTAHYLTPSVAATYAALERDRSTAAAIRSIRALNGVETPWRAPVPGWYRTLMLAVIRGRLWVSVQKQAELLGVDL